MRRPTISATLLGLCGTLAASPVSATTYHISTTGADSNSGTSPGSAWKTFAFAVPRLAPGDTLVLLEGTYTPAEHGNLRILCGSGSPNAKHGTASAPITVRAQNQRRAHLKNDGVATALWLYGCSYGSSTDSP